MRPKWYVPVATLALAGGSMLAFVGTAAASSAATRSGHVSMATRSGHVRVASGSGHVRVQSGGRAQMIRPFISARHGRNARTSGNWSGYAAHTRHYRSVSASWVEPRGHCSGTRHKYSSFWVGLDGFKTPTVEQTGTEVDCKGGNPKYYAWFEMFPKFPVIFSNTVRPGDHFHGSVTFNGGGKFTLKLSDTTRGWTHTEHKSLSSARRASAEVIVEAPSSSTGRILPLANFGTVHFSSAKVNGTKIGRHNPTKIIMQAGTRRKDTVSRLSRGQNFSVTWRHS
jgi:peptidase A4-like protein